MTGQSDSRPIRRRNWWKIGFFIALIAFEFTREAAVLAGDEKAEPNAMKSIFSMGDFVTARGSWVRSDGGSPIVPGTVTIECRKDAGQCVEASVMADGTYFFSPELDWFEARFTPEGVTYVNDQPDCARYSVRIDTLTDRAFATRERKANPANPNCEKLEPRIAMELGDGKPSIRDPWEGHFVPLVQAMMRILRLFAQ